MSECKCSLSTALCGEGCRYCQPQNHIDHMLEWLDDERKDNEQLRNSLIEVMEYPDCLQIENQSEILKRAINAIEMRCEYE